MDLYQYINWFIYNPSFTRCNSLLFIMAEIFILLEDLGRRATCTPEFVYITDNIFVVFWLMYPIIEHQSTLHTWPYAMTPSLYSFSLLVWGTRWLLAALCVNSVWEWPHTVGDVSILCPLTHHIPTRLISLPYTDRHLMHLFIRRILQAINPCLPVSGHLFLVALRQDFLVSWWWV